MVGQLPSFWKILYEVHLISSHLRDIGMLGCRNIGICISGIFISVTYNDLQIDGMGNKQTKATMIEKPK